MPVLLPQDVHIWSARRPPILPVDFEAVLSDGERTRAAGFFFQRHRLAYVFAHAILRDVLSRYLYCRPEDVRFGEDRFGKPFLDGTNCGQVLEFNLSHSGNLVLFALCQGQRVGVDCEQIRRINDLLSISKSYFTPEECAFILRQLPSDREREFLRCWTRKEAYVKAVGRGLAIPLNSFDTQISRGNAAVFLESDLNSITEWEVANLDLCEGYVAAVAIEEGMHN
ncbi:MAG: 4'-phosphopantetheinyl transferase superfamily protein, partial [Terracidiphilus sp.]